MFLFVLTKKKAICNFFLSFKRLARLHYFEGKFEFQILLRMDAKPDGTSLSTNPPPPIWGNSNRLLWRTCRTPTTCVLFSDKATGNDRCRRFLSFFFYFPTRNYFRPKHLFVHARFSCSSRYNFNTFLDVFQDLKDYMRQAGEVTYADAHKQHRNEG